mgnify:CR=1 FL=1
MGKYAVRQAVGGRVAGSNRKRLDDLVIFSLKLIRP